MQTESVIVVEAEDKLRWLRRLDGGRGWESLDDHRVCRCCGKTFSGRQLPLVGRTQGTAESDLFARHPPAPRRPPIGATHMNAEPRRNNPPCRSSVGRVLSASTRETCSEARSTEGELDVETQTRTSTSSEFAGLVAFVVRNVKSVVSKLTEPRRFPNCQSFREVMPKC